jgi:hypothetical protein
MTNAEAATRHMPPVSFQERQNSYARVAGVALLIIILSGVLGNHLVVWSDAATTARNLVTHELRFRVGLAGELLMLNADIVLALAFYMLLKPVGAGLALLGAFWRLTNAFLIAGGVIAGVVASDVLADPHVSAALTTFSAAQRPPLVLLFLDLHVTAMVIGLLPFSLGAAAHSWLLWRSRYIPRVLSGAYLLAVTVLFAGALTILLLPHLDATIDPLFIVPDFVVELVVALWLIIRAVRISDPHAAGAA